MKRILIYSTETPLGIGISSISSHYKAKEQAYIVPSASFIKKLKKQFSKIDPLKLKQIEFLTFDQLTRRLIAQEKKHLLTTSEQELLVKMAVDKVHKEGRLDYFKDSISKMGWLHQVELWIGEVKRAGMTSRILAELYNNQEVKYMELIQIYDAYQELLNTYDLIDHEQPYFDLIERLNNIKNQNSSAIPYKGIIIEQFYDFSPLQMQVLNQLGLLGVAIDVHLSYDHNRPELFQWTRNTIEYLNDLGFQSELQPVEKNVEIVVDSKSRISYLKKQLFSNNPIPFQENESTNQEVMDINLFSASGKKQELEMVATEIHQLHAENKEYFRFEDIAIIVPNIEDYKHEIGQMVNEFKIPVRLKKMEKLIDNPLIQSIISVLKAFHGNRNDWISLILSPYFHWNLEVDPYQWLFHFRGLGYPTTKKLWLERVEAYKKFDEQKGKEIEQYNAIMDKLFDYQTRIPKKGRYADFVHFLSFLENELQVKERLKVVFLNNPNDEIAYRDLIAYEQLNLIKEELIALDKFFAENERVTFWDWIQSFIIALEKREYNTTQGQIEGIHLLTPSQIRGQTFHSVFVMGLVEGEFPKAIKNNWLLPDQERIKLRENHVLLNTSRDFENQQKYNFYQCIAAAKQQIYLIYSAKTEDGKERLRSFYIDEVIGIIGNNIRVKERDNGDLVPKLWQDCVVDQQKLKKGLKELRSEDHTMRFKAIEELKELNSLTEDKRLNIQNGIESDLDRWRNDSSYDGYITEDKIKDILKDRIEKKIWSNTKLNEAMSCRFAYFAKDILKLSEWEEQEEALNPIEKGNLLHRILQRFLQAYKKESGNKILSKNQETYEKELQEIAKEEWNLFQQEGHRYLDPILSELNFEQLLQQLQEILLQELDWREKAESYFFPQFLEFSFGTAIKEEEMRREIVDRNSTVEKATISLQKHSIQLQGKIDRIDINDDGQFVIYDYKSGSTPANKEIKEGVNLQLPLYLLVVEAILGLPQEKAIGLAFYTPTSRNTGFWKQEYLNLVGLSNRIGSKYTEEEWELWVTSIKKKVDQLLDQLYAGDFRVLPLSECPSYCPFQHICRKNDERMKKKKLLGEDQNGISIN